MGQISAYLDHLADKRNVAASTQSQALNVLVFLFKQIPHRSHALHGNAAVDALCHERDAERPGRRYHAERGNDGVWFYGKYFIQSTVLWS